MPTFLERKINQAWANCFVQGNANFLPAQMPTSQPIPQTGPYDTGTPIPDLWILLGRVPVGDAQATIGSGTIDGLDSIEPDPNQPQIAFGTNDATATISVTFTGLTLDGSWVITQTMDDTTGCAGPKFVAAFRGAGSGDGSDVLNKVRDDLQARGGAMGAWYVNEYYAHTAALKAVLDDAGFQQAVDQYDGNQIWQLIVSGIGSGTSDVPPSLQGDALALVAAAAQYANDAALTDAIDQAMNYVPAYIGKTYDEVVTTIASQTPPSSAGLRRSAVPMAGGAFVQTWTGSFDGTASVTASVTVDIATGEDGAAPTITTTSVSLTFNELSLSFGGANFDSAVTAWLMTIFKSKVEKALEKAVTSQYANSDDTKKKIGDALTSAVAAIWSS